MDNFVLNIPKEYWPTFGAANSPCLFRFFESKKSIVVLSASNQEEAETHVDVCHASSVPILRRKGGGGCVVLGSGCLILTFAFYANNLFNNKHYFHQINDLWVRALTAYGIKNLSQNGISDICIGDKKVAGTSIFRKKHLLVYQGSLLVNPDFSRIATLLKYPSRAPEYRKNRSHEDFLTSLYKEGLHIDMKELIKHCQSYFNQNIEAHLKDDFM